MKNKEKQSKSIVTPEFILIDNTPLDSGLLVESFVSDEQIKSCIDNLSVSAEIKLLLGKLATYTISISEKIINFGKKILELAIFFFNKHKVLCISIIVGLIIAGLIAYFPAIGSTLSQFSGPLTIMSGGIELLIENYADEYPEIVESIEQSMGIFKILKHII
ncbi:MAG: hypothetical protein P8H22_09845 [Glaciecola sp.]|nr:hypothetical protein [Glaciecola sp.]